MKVFLSPHVSGERIRYSFMRETITVRYRGEMDTFDFTDMPDGELTLYDNEGNDLIETSLEINPILSAKRVDGVLYVELLNFIGVDATEEECFPEWIDVRDYKAPKEVSADGKDAVEK